MTVYSFAAVFASLSFFMILQPSLAELELWLASERIDADGKVSIPNIGTNNQGQALICRHGNMGVPPSAEIDRWYYVDDGGTEIEVTDTGENGFTRIREQNEGSVRLERNQGSYPLEGIYKCTVHAESITVKLYWPVMDLEVAMEVVAQMVNSKVYTVTCRSTGGRLKSSSLTGPQGESLGALALLGDQERLRGRDNYSILVERTGGENGDVYTCNVTTEGSTHTKRSVLSVAPSVHQPKAVQIPSTSPSLNITWTLDSEGAIVTNYTIHFTSNGTGDGSSHHDGSVSTSGNESMVIIEELIADGRMYRMMVEARSIHFSSFSDYFYYTPCVVSSLTLESRTHDSLSLVWNRPSYYSGSFKGLLHYAVATLHEDEIEGDSRWLYIESAGSESDDVALPVINGLQEITGYSVRLAVFDESDRMCTFSSPFIAQTGLGPVRSLNVLMEEDGIMLSWSPPPVPSDTSIMEYTVAYTVSGASRPTVTFTKSTSWRISAEQGDVFTITVTPFVGSDAGESTSVTVGVDYKYFRIAIDVGGSCSDILEEDSGLILDAVVEQVSLALTNSCSCSVQISEARFECPNSDQNSVHFHGTIFAPVGVSSSSLLAKLDNWASRGPKLTLPGIGSVKSQCRPSEMYTESSECMGSSLSGLNDSEETSKGLSPSLLAGVAIGSLLVGALGGLVITLLVCMFKRWHTQMSLKRKARNMVTSDGFEDNPRYVSTGEYTTKPSTRALPLLPFTRRSRKNLTFTNHITATHNKRTPKEISNTSQASTQVYETINDSRKPRRNEESYEGITGPKNKVPNPMYEMVELPKRKESQQRLLPAEELSTYEEMQRVKKSEVEMKNECEEEYVKMMPGSVTSLSL